MAKVIDGGSRARPGKPGTSGSRTQIRSSNLTQELRECLAIQEDISAQQHELRCRYKAVIEGERAKGNNGSVSVIIEGEIWVLERAELKFTDELKSARELGGFWNYRLTRLGRPVS